MQKHLLSHTLIASVLVLGTICCVSVIHSIGFCSCLTSVQASAVSCLLENLLNEGKGVRVDAPHQQYQEATTSYGRHLPREVLL